VTALAQLATAGPLVRHNISAGPLVAILAIAAMAVIVLVVVVSFTLSRRAERGGQSPAHPGTSAPTGTLSVNPPLPANADRPAR
jgi:hypothetical protein